MKRIHIFAKGNVDVHDSLAYSRVNDQIVWNGLDTLVAERHPNHTVRVRHESCARWDRAGLPQEAIPEELSAKQIDLGTMTLQAQFQSQLGMRPCDVVVLSVQPDVCNPLRRHRRHGYTFFEMGLQSPDHDRWIDDTFDVVPRVTPDEAMKNLDSLTAAIRARSNAIILVYNMSPIVPGEHIVSYRGFADSESALVRAFNVALIDFTKSHDVLLVDVDQIVARAGADRLKLDLLHYHAEGYKIIAAEVLRILEDQGLFDDGRS
ncbi:MAG: SGNH/GDSL hydrolase family protein [Polyangiaceae bacterium]